MSHGELFSEFLESLNLNLKQTEKVGYRYRKVTKSLSLTSRGTSSRVANRLKVGSVGRYTAIKDISDLDMLYIIPPNQYEYYSRKNNGQSTLLTDVRNILAGEYSDQTVKEDKLVVQIIFKNFYVEVQPIFRQDDDNFKFPGNYNGGAWCVTKPLRGKAAMTAFSRDKSNNLRKLCKMIRAWKNLYGVNMDGLLIDTLAYRFFSSTSDYDNTRNGSLGTLAKDFFEYLSNEERKGGYLALGSNQHVRVKSPWFGRTAKHAYELCCDVLDAGGAASENNRWHKVLGRAFPRHRVGIVEARLGLESHAADAVPWTDTEEFIEDKYPVDIGYSLNLNYTITQDGSPPRSLGEMPIRRFRLSARKSLLFRADLTEMEAEELYTIMRKVLNVGDKVCRGNMIREQIVSDGDYCTEKGAANFRGGRMVECYVMKDGVVVARIQIEVPID